MSNRNYAVACILGLISGANLAFGLSEILSKYSIQDRARTAIYAKAENLTPEVVNRANSEAGKLGTLEGVAGVLGFGVAGLCGAAALARATKKE